MTKSKNKQHYPHPIVPHNSGKFVMFPSTHDDDEYEQPEPATCMDVINAECGDVLFINGFYYSVDKNGKLIKANEND